MAAALHTEENKVQGCVSQVSCFILTVSAGCPQSHLAFPDSCVSRHSVDIVGNGTSTLAAIQVWVHPRVDNGKIFWEADSDSALTKVHSIVLANVQLEMHVATSALLVVHEHIHMNHCDLKRCLLDQASDMDN